MTQLEHLDTYGRLLGAHPDDDWDPEVDLVDARALIRIVRGLRELSENLAGDADAQAGVKSFETWVMKRGGGVMLEELWELPRCRTLGQPLLSKSSQPVAFGQQPPEAAWVSTRAASTRSSSQQSTRARN